MNPFSMRPVLNAMFLMNIYVFTYDKYMDIS